MNMLDLIVIILFLLGIWRGYRRGFILQVVHLVGFIIAYMVAFRYLHEISPILEEWIPYPFHDQKVVKPLWMQLVDTEKMFYSAISFALLFFGTKIALQIVAHLLNLIALLPGLNMANRWLGVTLGFLEVFIIVFIGVHILLFIPWETGQNMLNESVIGLWMTEYTPFVSEYFQNLWDKNEL